MLSTKDFFVQINDFKKIRDYEDNSWKDQFGIIITRAAFLVGIKNEISDLNKSDIVDMLQTNYGNLSLEEINLAFKHDRYSSKPVDHFHLVDAIYVNKVILKYMEFRKEKKKAYTPKNNILVTEKKSEDQILKTRLEFIENVRQELIQKEFSLDAWLLYDRVECDEKNDNAYKGDLVLKYQKKERELNKWNQIKKSTPINLAKSEIVSNHLLKSCHDREKFLAQIDVTGEKLEKKEL